jgi:hypothetical protein
LGLQDSNQWQVSANTVMNVGFNSRCNISSLIAWLLASQGLTPMCNISRLIVWLLASQGLTPMFNISRLIVWLLASQGLPPCATFLGQFCDYWLLKDSPPCSSEAAHPPYKDDTSRQPRHRLIYQPLIVSAHVSVCPIYWHPFLKRARSVFTDEHSKICSHSSCCFKWVEIMHPDTTDMMSHSIKARQVSV